MEEYEKLSEAAKKVNLDQFSPRKHSAKVIIVYTNATKVGNMSGKNLYVPVEFLRN